MLITQTYSIGTSILHIALRNGRFSEQSHLCKRNACKVTRVQVYFISNEYLPLSFNLVQLI